MTQPRSLRCLSPLPAGICTTMAPFNAAKKMALRRESRDTTLLRHSESILETTFLYLMKGCPMIYPHLSEEKKKTWNRKNLPTANPVAVWVFFWSLLIRFWVALPMLHQRLFTVYIVPLLLCSYPIHGHRRFVSNHLLVASSWWFQPIPRAVVKSLSPVETI